MQNGSKIGNEFEILATAAYKIETNTKFFLTNIRWK